MPDATQTMLFARLAAVQLAGPAALSTLLTVLLAATAMLAQLAMLAPADHVLELL